MWRWRPVIIPQFDLQTEFPDLESEDSEGKEMGEDITGIDIESQNQEAEAAAGNVLPVQIERRFNKLSTLIVHSLTPVPFFLSFYIHSFIPHIKVLTIWHEVVRWSVHTSNFISQYFSFENKKILSIFGYNKSYKWIWSMPR